MIEILLLWTITVFICFVFGEALINTMRINNTSMAVSIIAGWCLLITLTNLISLFIPVDRIVLMALLVVAAGLAVTVCRKSSIVKIKSLDIKAVLSVVVSMGFFSIMSFAFMEQVGDTLLYHAQAIRWINEYGAVKGIANLVPRMGFNNSIFCFYALGANGLYGEGVHSLLGFVLWIFSMYFLETSVRCITSKRYGIAVYSLSMLAYVILNAGVGSTYLTDYPANCLAGFILIEWLLADGDIVKKECFLCVLAVVLATIKVSMAPILLLAVHPIYVLCKDRQYKKIVASVVACIIMGLPFVIRNVIISGWLLFPLSAIDLFDVSWKVPIEAVEKEANWVYSWARIPGSDWTLTLNSGPFAWVKLWMLEETTFYKIIYLISAIGLIVVIVRLVSKKNDEIYLPYIVSLICLIYWFCTAPDVRFVNALLFFVMWAPLMSLLDKKAGLLQGITIVLVLIASPTIINFVNYINNVEHLKNITYGQQIDFDESEYYDEYIGEVRFSYFTNGRPGNHELPCIYIPSSDDIVLLGDDISDGVAVGVSK